MCKFIKVHYLFLSFVACIAGCGYKSIPDQLNHINSVTVSTITNDTKEYGLDEDMRNAIKQEFSRSTRWGEGMDSVFTATINVYEIQRMSLSQNNQPEQYRLVMGLSFVYQDLKRNKVVRDEKNYVKMHDFFVVPGRGKPPETLKEAKQNLIKEISEDIVSSIVEEW